MARLNQRVIGTWQTYMDKEAYHDVPKLLAHPYIHIYSYDDLLIKYKHGKR